jgi:hypothetical protein
MSIYKEPRKAGQFYRKLYEQHYGPIPIEPNGRRYEIHHIDGDYTNNHPDNLMAVSLQEHFDIHKSQGDYKACTLLAIRLKLTPSEVSDISSKAQRSLVLEGKHHLSKTGLDHPKSDHTVYRLENIISGEIKSGTRKELIRQCNIDDNNICRLIKGRNKTQLNWKIV